ncbi:hypothetical protein Acr_00g0104600 [Actinidia rufa]|uniref:Uncharacterized protein n=1 Tax=Actinidia rufa TaxID=165716 RepID=A0A7J0D776_9ERIC|nr:hypothetical protein Acr_00g0003650 [Actinidia rufa]GFS28763.1 hypothetical protein Acr_00g0003760 [Actinidia rufa]GFS46916.1 hypothetical protein Acr_00g0104580 [Actinidia rufa]GFS46920.1 hypothetical protein Acr_00g0104600 [Actinidia rufa]
MVPEIDSDIPLAQLFETESRRTRARARLEIQSQGFKVSRATSVVIYENPGGQTEPGDDPSSDESEDLARTVSSEVSRTEHVFVTNEDEISPKEAIAKLNKSLEERLDKMMKIKEAMRAIICSKDKAEQGDTPI